MKITSASCTFISLFLLTLTSPRVVRACDICGCYTPNQELNYEPLRQRHRGFYAAIAEQYTYFGTVQQSGREVPNVADQFERSSITQLIAGWNIIDRLGVQVNVPLIYRDYKRPAGFINERGSESGLGDVSLLVNAVAFRKEAGFHPTVDPNDKNAPPASALIATGHGGQPDFTFSLNLIAGVKFPTGSARRLKEMFNEEEMAGSAPASVIEGHDLALGSGSYDAVLGAGIFARYKAAFFQANVQYTVRTTGAYDYRYANDLTFDTGPGYYFLQNRRLGALGDTTLGLQFVISGEHKNRDTFRGEIMEDSGITTLYVGPRIVAGFGSRLIAEFGADLPVLIDNTALQIVPDYRLRAGFSYRF